jgi:hypothetical protein
VIATADAAALRTLISVLQTSQIQSWSSLTAVNSGTADALVGVYSPVITAATNNMLLILECNAANTITTPTFTPANGVLVAKTIVRSNGGALAVGDIAGANFKALLCFDTSLDQWILINPYSGPTQLTATVSRASNTILALADNNSFIYSTGTFTQTLTAAATLGNGWHVTYRNDGTGIITIDPNGGELIDGATTIRLYRGESCVITCTGTAFITSGRSTGMVLIDQKIASSSATLDFVQGFNSDFDELHFRITALTPATNDTILYTRISEDGGSTYKAGGSDYATQNLSLQAGVVAGSVGTAAQASSGFGASNTITEGGANGEYQLFNATSTVADKWWKWSLAGQRSGSGPLKIDGNGRYITDAGAINGFRFLFAAGNIASGTISMYGLRK